MMIKNQDWVFLLYERNWFDKTSYEVIGVYKNADDVDTFLHNVAVENGYFVEEIDDDSYVNLIDSSDEERNRYFYIRAMKLN